MAPSPDRRRWPPRPGVVAAVVVALGVGAAVAVAASGSDPEDASPTTTTTTTTLQETTTTTEPVPEAVTPEEVAVVPIEEATPDSYRITYELVENGLPRTETITVVRPYESLVRSERDGQLISGTATSRERLWTYLADRDGWLVVQPELHRAAYDHRPLRAMAMAMSLGLAEERPGRQVAGVPCRVFATGQPIGSSGMVAPDPAEETELCIDDRGLVLHERWTIGTSVVVERTATAVEVGIDADPALFEPTPVVEDAEVFEAILSTIAVPADEETLARLQTDIVPPPSFALDGAVLRSGDPQQGGSATEIVRFWSDGVNLIEVAEVSSATGVQLDHGGAIPLEIDGPETWFWPDLRASAVRVRLSDTSYVELRGTDPAQLIGLLDTLTRRVS